MVTPDDQRCKCWPKIYFPRPPTTLPTVCPPLPLMTSCKCRSAHPSYRRSRLPQDMIRKATHQYIGLFSPRSTGHVSWLKVGVGPVLLVPLLPDLALPPPPLLPVTIGRPPGQLVAILCIAPTSARGVLPCLHLSSSSISLVQCLLFCSQCTVNIRIHQSRSQRGSYSQVPRTTAQNPNPAGEPD